MLAKCQFLFIILMSETEESCLANFCNQHCKVKEPTIETYYSR